jgi:hypothetical protein
MNRVEAEEFHGDDLSRAQLREILNRHEHPVVTEPPASVATSGPWWFVGNGDHLTLTEPSAVGSDGFLIGRKDPLQP